MASFPTSVKEFTTKNTNDVIQASHINDLQSEVTAIEDGLLNGTAPLSSSNVTFNRLTVNQTSTFTGNVQFNGTASTFSGAVAIGGIAAFTGPIYRQAIQTLGLSSGNNNNVALVSSATIVELAGSANGSTITGFTGGAHGRTVSIVNAGAPTVVIAVLSTGSLAANQIMCPRSSALQVEAGCGLDIYYSTASNVWRAIAGTRSV